MKNSNYYDYFLILFLIIIVIYFIYINTTAEAFTDDIVSNSLNISNAYVINLDNRTERWGAIKNKFNNSDIQLRRLSAIKHANGHYGCGLSFMKAVRFAKENNLETILIFEDDNKPLVEFNKRWLVIKKWLDNNLDKWEIYNGAPRFPDWTEYWFKNSSPYVHKTKLAYSIGNNEYLFESPIVLALNWTYINKNAYDKVLQWETLVKNDKSLAGIDSYLGSRKYFKNLFSIPLLGLQESGNSDTEPGLYQDFEKTDKTIIKIFNDVYEKEVNVKLDK